MPFIVHHLADEMRLTVENTRKSGVGDRPLQGLIRQLKNQTDQKLGTDVNGWIKWYEKNTDRYDRWSDKLPRGVTPQLAQDYRWFMTTPGWDKSLRSVLAQRGNDTINPAPFLGALTYLDRNIGKAPIRQFLRVAAAREVIDDLLKHRDEWNFVDPSKGRLIYSGGVPSADELEFWMKRVRKRIEGRWTKLFRKTQ